MLPFYFYTRKATCYILACFIVVFGVTAMNGCSKLDSTLSAARNIAGTWKASAPVTVYYMTNCNSSTVYTYKTFQCKFTFVITAIDDNNVNVSISGDFYNVTNDNCGQSPPIAGGYPIIFSGVVSSSKLNMTDYIYSKNSAGHVAAGNYNVGTFAFTSNILTGSIYWLQYYSSLDCIGWSTGSISLTKQ